MSRAIHKDLLLMLKALDMTLNNALVIANQIMEKLTDPDSTSEFLDTADLAAVMGTIRGAHLFVQEILKNHKPVIVVPPHAH